MMNGSIVQWGESPGKHWYMSLVSGFRVRDKIHVTLHGEDVVVLQ